MAPPAAARLAGRKDHEDADADAGKPDCYGMCLVPSIRFGPKAVVARLAGGGVLKIAFASKPAPTACGQKQIATAPNIP